MLKANRAYNIPYVEHWLTRYAFGRKIEDCCGRKKNLFVYL